METQYLNVPGGRLAYDVTGQGPLVVCAPSMGDIRGEYRFLAPRLVAAGFRVATMDVRGHGESSVRWDDYTVGAIGADMLALARSLGEEPAFLAGVSMAAGAAVWAAVEAPERVAGIVLLDPIVRDFDSAMPAWMTRALYATLFADPWGVAVWKRYYASLYPTAKPSDFADYLQRLTANLREPGRLAALRQMIFASKAASGNRLTSVRVPALVLMGTTDRDFKDPAGEARYIGEQVHAPVHLIDGAGHYPHAEMPDKAAPLVASFLTSVRGGVVPGQ